MYRVCLPWDRCALSNLSKPHGKIVDREKCLASSWLFQPTHMRCLTCDFKKQSWTSSSVGLQVTPAPDSIWLQPHKRPQVRTSKLRVVNRIRMWEIIINSYFKLLNFGVVCYMVIENWNSSFVVHVLLSLECPPTLLSYSYTYSYLHLSKNLCLVWHRAEERRRLWDQAVGWEGLNPSLVF